MKKAYVNIIKASVQSRISILWQQKVESKFWGIKNDNNSLQNDSSIIFIPKYNTKIPCEFGIIFV